MWYRLMKWQAMVFVPPYVLYCLLRRIPFYMRCKKCRAWLDTLSMRGGICEKCHRAIVLSDPVGYFVESDDAIRQAEVARVAFRSARLRHVMYRKVVARLGSGKVLDVGCGQGYLFLELPPSQSNLYGLDLGKFDIRRAKEWVKRANFCLADAQNIPFKSDTFDHLVCTEVLEHLPTEMGRNVVSECYRVLKPRGVAIFTVPNGHGPAGEIDVHHIRLFTFKSITALLREAGFEIVNRQKFGLYIPFLGRLVELLNGATGNRLPLTPFLDIEVPESLAITFLIECRKARTTHAIA